MSTHASKLFAFTAAVVWSGLGVASLFPAMFSVMMFDSPGSESNPLVIAMFASVISFPVVCFATVAKILRASKEQAYSRACLLACIPLINIAIVGAAAAFGLH
jgi:hypothetical protein